MTPYLCPFCGTMPEVISRGNEHTKRSVTIRCASCRAERTDAGITSTSGELLSVAIGNWNQRRTPPTPAGAGTETPKIKERLKNLVAGLKDSEAFQHECAILKLEDELTSLRRQAEADRATKQELQEKLGAYLIDLSAICAANDIKGLPCQQPRFIGEYIASLRAQLASADKDRERLAEARNGLRATQDLLWNNPTESACAAYEIADRLLKGTVQHVSAALQPSPSLDHGARGKKP